MKAIIDILAGNSLLLLFVVTAVGYPLGKIRIKGVSFGISSVLFTGIAFGALDPGMRLPEIVYILGLAFFVYSIGLSSGHSFVISLRRHGVRDNIFAILVLVSGVFVAYIASRFLGINSGISAGMYCGSLTNTPALAGILDTIESHAASENVTALLTRPVVGYSLTYPFGVIGVILAITMARRIWKVDFASEARNLKKLGGVSEVFYTRSILVEKMEATNFSLYEFFKNNELDIVAGRLKRGPFYSLVASDALLRVGDVITLTGSKENIERATRLMGSISKSSLEFDSTQFDHRRIFVSNRKIEGRTLRELDVEGKFGAIVSRLRRGDVDMLVHPDTILEPGDRIRVVAQRERMDEISLFFGDSYREASEMDLLTFSIGLAAGLLLGMIPLPLFGVTIKLGFAGGPLIAGLILGALEHTGKLVWNLPYSSHIVLRQIGLVFFLAGIGTRAGYGFASVLAQGGGLNVFLGGLIITTSTSFIALWIGYRRFKIPLSLLSGMLAGIVTQPAVLAYALEETGNDLPNIGYASVFPLATIFKILAVQILFFIMNH